MKYIKRFSEISINDVAQVGGKNASLGEMYQALGSHGIKVPNGFATTAAAFFDFLNENNLQQKIDQALASLDHTDLIALAETGARIRQWIIRATLSKQLEQELREAYRELSKEYGSSPDVAIRSSATAEDLPDASFAGQQETYLNIRGTDNLLVTCKRVFASLYTNRAISYRIDQGFADRAIALSIGVQKMARSDLGSSGVMFTLDTESGFRDVVFITGAFGLGENIVQGAVDPDEFYVYKPALVSGKSALLKQQLGSKLIKMVYGSDAMAGVSTRNVSLSKQERNQFCITRDEVTKLAHAAVVIEQHYSKHHKRDVPMDIEWVKDGMDGEIYIVQARPETVESQRPLATKETYSLIDKGKLLLQGKSIGSKIVAGKVRIIMNTGYMHDLKRGEILVTDITDPDWEPIMKIAGAIVTNRGGRTCHAAIIARELGIPAIVGTSVATQLLHTGDEVTVSCADGNVGSIYEGVLAYHRNLQAVDLSQKTMTSLMINIANPNIAFDIRALPHEGAGLVRLEFIISNSVGIHPQALIDYDHLNSELQENILERTSGYENPQQFYVQQLIQGIATIAAAFNPYPVIVRFSDFKSNEYAALLGGDLYEPKEENPMIGFRGASRYPSKAFTQAFALECQALKTVRETMGFDNVKVMIPFVRTVSELKAVLSLMEINGLVRGKNGLEVIVMCEIPANALLADDFLEHCDGFSIGSNDLTQLTLGVDRDSGLLTGYDERDPAVYKLMAMAIEACKRHNKYIGICGQAPSDFPEITHWLVEQEVSSISFNPDSLLRMREVVLEAEKN